MMQPKQVAVVILIDQRAVYKTLDNRAPARALPAEHTYEAQEASAHMDGRSRKAALVGSVVPWRLASWH
jgi:hypothetical protein